MNCRFRAGRFDYLGTYDLRKENYGNPDLRESAGQELDKSIEFFTALGYKFNPQFTDETATCMIVSDDIFVMLLTEATFKTFTTKPVSDATKSTEVLVCLSCESKSDVDEMVRKALAAGGTVPMEAKDYGFMYAHGYTDLDGHVWELMHMDPSAAGQG